MIAALIALLAVVNSPVNSVTYSCDGSTAVFTVSFPYLSSGDLVVTSTTSAGAVTTLTQGTDWTTNLSATSSTATLTLNSPATKCPTGNTFKIRRTMALTQPTSYKQQNNYSPSIHEQSYDRITMIAQQNATLPVGGDLSGNLPSPTLAPSGVAAGTYGNATNVPVITIDAKGRATSASVVPVQATGTNTLYTAPFTGSVPIASAAKFAQIVSVKEFGAVGDGTTPEDTAVTNACASTALTGDALVFPVGNYSITNNLTCGAPTIWFRGGSKLVITAGKTFTANGRVISLEGDPTTGTGAIVYVDQQNIFANGFGFAVGNTPSVNTDDFIHFQRDVNNNSGILVKNLNTGALVDAFVHLWGGPLSGGTQGSDLRMSATSQAGGRLVNLVAGNAAAFSIISSSTSGTVDTYAGNVRQTSVEPVTTAVNYLGMKGGAAGSGPSIYPRGTDTNVNLTVGSQGTGSVLFRTDLTGTPRFQFEVHDLVGSTAWPVVKGSAGGSPVLTTSNLAPINIQVPISITAVTNATLGTPANGTISFCSDCTIANPCAGGGTGALAKRLNGAWICN